MEIKKDDYVYVYATGLTLQVKSDDYLENYFNLNGSYAGKYTSLWMAESALNNGLAEKV